ncbi:MAG: hypothetical protein ACO1HP_09590 [Bacteroidota bacterium]
MAAHKLIESLSNGNKQEYAGKTTSAGAGDSGEFPVLDGSGKLDSSFMPAGIGADTITADAGENLAAGDFVYFDSSGDVFKADASAIAKAAVGYVLDAVTSGQPATVYFDDANTSVTGLTVGSKYYLSGSTPGAITTTAPTTSGHIVQSVGVPHLATSLHVRLSEPVIRA